MRARLTRAWHDCLSWARRHNPMPPQGPNYELFDLAALFWIIVVSSYAIAEPSPSTSAALQWLIGPTPLELWSIGLNMAALGALICSFVPAAVRFGRGLVFGAASVWCGVLTLGWLADYDATTEAMAEGVRMGFWFALATVIFATGLHVSMSNRKPARALLSGLMGGVIVYAIVLLLTWSGDPRPFASAVLYGFVARTAYHQTHTACRPLWRP